ncbi:MAG: hypothetical protein JSV09_03075 [Thermoplasmata archaeon]|nr:MAG: hypothetical protein JSV09_03075 [Thermoplasmata archaeon]
MDMVEEQESKLFFLGIFPKCPFYYSALHMVLMIGIMVLGTLGLTFLNLWIAMVYLAYFIVFYFLVMPLIHCQHCYYRVVETKEDKTVKKLLPLDEWRESCLKKHVECGKKWGFNFFISWFLPIILIGISLFLSFSTMALIYLIGFIIVLAVMLIHMRWIVCPKCAIVNECHAAF